MSGMAAEGYARSKLRKAPALQVALRRYTGLRVTTYEFGVWAVAPHKPPFKKGHKSIILTTIDFVTSGLKGGLATTGFIRVS